MGDEACYNLLREIRWENGVCCPRCNSHQIVKDGFHETHAHRQTYGCKSCDCDFDDLTGTIFSGSKKTLKVWILCLYLMGLNLSNLQISKELDITEPTAQRMTELLRKGIVKKNLIYNLRAKLRPMKFMLSVGTKDNLNK